MDQQLAQISALAAGPPPASVPIFNRLPVVCQTDFTQVSRMLSHKPASAQRRERTSTDFHLP